MKLADLLPREEKFFLMLEEVAKQAHLSAKHLKVLAETTEPSQRQEAAAGISDAKSKAKKVSETVTAEVCRTFITPFDREDIQDFAFNLYKIPKIIEKIKERIILHNLTARNGDFSRQVFLILQEAEAMSELVHELINGRNSKRILEKNTRLHELEQQGDEVLRVLLVELFESTTDTRELILRKDIYDMMEKVIDRFRDASNVALQIVLKHS